MEENIARCYLLQENMEETIANLVKMVVSAYEKLPGGGKT